MTHSVTLRVVAPNWGLSPRAISAGSKVPQIKSNIWRVEADSRESKQVKKEVKK